MAETSTAQGPSAPITDPDTNTNDESSSLSPELFHLSINPTAPTTIVLIHGVLSSHLEWAHVTPFLSPSKYHLLLVDSPSHSRSSATHHTTTIPSAADAVASLIRARAHNSVAHVVGLSMGGFVALDLLRRHPSLVSSLFVTGAHPFTGSYRYLASHPWMIWYMLSALHALPDAVYDRICDWGGMERHPELRKEMVRNLKWETVRDVYSGCLELDEQRLGEIAAQGKPVLAVAGGKGDQVEATRGMGPLLRGAGEGEAGRSRAVTVEKATHAWDLQFPELFARGIEAWVEGRDLPAEFVLLS